MPMQPNNSSLIKQRLNSRFQPAYVRYWDRAFFSYVFWEQWLSLKQTILLHTIDIQSELGCQYREALEVVWSTYIEVTSGEKDNPFVDDYITLIQSITSRELPLYLCHTCIGTDIQNGHSEEEAVSIYIDWLNDDVDNPIFGNWALTNDLTVIPTTQFLRKQTR